MFLQTLPERKKERFEGQRKKKDSKSEHSPVGTIFPKVLSRDNFVTCKGSFVLLIAPMIGFQRKCASFHWTNHHTILFVVAKVEQILRKGTSDSFGI